MNKKIRTQLLTAGILSSLSVKVNPVKIGDETFQQHAMKSPHTKTVVILQDKKDRLYLAPKSDLSKKFEVTSADIQALAGNVVNGSVDSILIG